MSRTVRGTASRRAVTVAVLGNDELLARRVELAARAAGLSTADTGSVSIVLLPCPVFRAREAETVRVARVQHPNVPLLVVSGFDDPARIRAALEAGATGVLSARELETGLGAAVAAAEAGLTCLPGSYREAVARPIFTTREKQVLGMVVLGMSNDQIGRRLYLAESTVKSHLKSAFTKLGVRSRNEATARILDPESGLGPGILTVASRVTVREG
jgi:DNA-binding NarL/FixJ family response regulator